MILFSQHQETNTDYILLHRGIVILLFFLLPLVGRGQVDTLNVPETTTAMKEVVIKAPKILIVQKGDTLIYNADLLDLAQSAMLKELIQALPDVHIDLDGRITVKGEPIQELLIEGRDFFNGDKKIALENLPAFTVQKVKVYRKVPFDAYLKRKNRGEKALVTDPMVMNVRLKAKYQNGFIGNTELAGGIPTQGKADLLYLWHIFGLHYNKRHSLGVNMNTNNVNDAGRALSNGTWSSMVKEEGDVKSTIGKVDYSYTNPENRMTVNSSLKITNRIQFLEQEKSSMQYPLDGIIYENSKNELTGKTLNAAWNGRYMYPARKFTIQLIPQVDIGRNRGLSNNRSITFSEQSQNGVIGNMIGTVSNRDLLDLEEDSLLVHRQTIQNEDKTEVVNIGLSSMFTIRVPFLKQALFINSEENFSTSKLRQHTLNQMYYSINQTKDNRELYRSSHSYRSNFSIDVSNIILSHRKKNHRAEITAELRMKYSQNGWDNNLYNLDLLSSCDDSFDWEHLPNAETLLPSKDLKNSYRVVEKDLGSQFALKGSYDFSSNIGFNSILPFQLKHRNIFDERGEDKIALTRSDWLIQPSFSFTYKSYSVGYKINSSLPNMRDLIERKDDSNPMLIIVGNGALKKSIKHTVYLNISQNFNKNRASLNSSIEYSSLKDVIKLMSYSNIQTGRQILQQRNVDGDWISHITINYRQVLDKSSHWVLSYNMQGEIGQEGIYDRLGNVEQPVSHTATRGQIYNNIDLTYKGTNISLALKSSNRWRHTKSLQHFFNNTNYFDFVNGVSLKFFLWNHINVDSDIMWRIKRGAENSRINQNNVIWNLLLSWDITGHWTLKAEGFDILRQLSATYASSTATGWANSQKNVLSSYYMIHATYRFNILPK